MWYLLFIIAAIIGSIAGVIQLIIWLHRVLESKRWWRNAKDNETDLIGVAIITNRHSVLMVRRRVIEGRLGWQFPAANVGSKEGLRSRIMNETTEETGIKSKFHRILGERIHPDTNKYVVYLALDYVSGSPNNGQPTENSDVRWVDIRDARKLLTSDLSADVADYLSLFQHD